MSKLRKVEGPNDLRAVVGEFVPVERAEKAEAEVARLRRVLDQALSLVREAECGIVNAWDREKEAGEEGPGDDPQR